VMDRLKSAFQFSFLMITIFALQGCVTNEGGGFALGSIGKKGSHAWHMSASNSEKSRYYSSQSEVGLCNMWAENYPGGRPAWRKNREDVGNELVKRGLSAMYCANPTADETNVARDAAATSLRRAKAAEAEAQNQRNLACNAARQAYNQCMISIRSTGGTCSIPYGC